MTGGIDGQAIVWDLNGNEKTAFEAHSMWISQVKVNQKAENVFLSGAYDGEVKLWDLRNSERPIATLKRKEPSGDDFKVFAVEWNGPSQILSGGSDSHVSVHEML